MKIRKLKIWMIFACLWPFCSYAQFPPPAGQAGTTAIYEDSAVIVSWATGCEIIRGWQNIADTTIGKTDVGDSSSAIGPAGENGVVSLGDGGSAVLTFNRPISNGDSWDFAVFENSFSDVFLELAFVDVSSDGVNYFRFPATSLSDTAVQTGTFDTLDATRINNLAGKYRALYGTPFDLQELEGTAGLDINHVTHVKITDVVGSLEPVFASHDALAHKINDPWPTPFGSSGFDLDAVAVIHEAPASVEENAGAVDFNVFPNPARGFINILLSNPHQNTQIALFTIQGAVIKEFTSDVYNLRMDLKGIPAGIYILKLINDGGCKSKKITVF